MFIKRDFEFAQYNESFKDYTELNEAMIKNVEDIYYNKDKFDSGEINLCFITGHSGSGKSSMAGDMKAAEEKIDHAEIDDVIFNFYYTDEQLKSMSNLLYSYLTGTGKQYRVQSVTDIKKDQAKYKDKNTVDFVNYSINYAKAHRDTKFIVEGCWLYFYIDPASLKDYAVYIKGTSAFISSYRASKRDATNVQKAVGIKNCFYTVKNMGHHITNILRNDVESKVQSYRDYFNRLNNNESVNESDNNWKLTENNTDRKVFESSHVKEEDYQRLHDLEVIMRTCEKYKDYKKAFDEFCNYCHINPNGTIITGIKIKSGKDKESNYIWVEYSYNTRKVKLDEGSKLYHMSPADGIKELIPQFRGKSAKGFLYDRPRVYLTIKKHMAKFAADLNSKNKTHYYEVEDYKVFGDNIYVDPLLTSKKLAGAIYVVCDKPIKVKQLS